MANFAEKTDIELVTLYKTKGDGFYLGELYKRYTKLVFVLCYKYLKDRDVAQEAVAQIFESLIVSLKKYQIDNFKSWLMTVSRNHCLMMLKCEKGIVEYCDFFEKNIPEVVEFEDIFYQDDRDEKERILNRLNEAVDTLPKEQKTCIELFYLGGKSYAEIIESTGYDFKQIKSYLQNGRRNLKNYLSKESIFLIFLSDCLLTI